MTKVMKKEKASELGTEKSEKLGTVNTGDIKREVKTQDNIDPIAASSDAAKWEAGSKVELVRAAMKKYLFILYFSLNDLENEYKLDSGSILTEKVSFVAVNLQYETQSAHGRLNSSHGVFSKERFEACNEISRQRYGSWRARACTLLGLNVLSLQQERSCSQGEGKRYGRGVGILFSLKFYSG